MLRDEKLIFSKVDEPISDWLDVSDIFISVLNHEEYMLDTYKNLYKAAG